MLLQKEEDMKAWWPVSVLRINQKLKRGEAILSVLGSLKSHANLS